MKLGAFELPNRLFVAPMAGVTDRPFRMLCRRLGAGHAVSEMVTSRRELWSSLKTSRRADHSGEPGPIAVQIAGVDPAEMADAARYNIDRGAQIIDINMGCPAKKVCNVFAGSALMSNEPLALAIVEAVVAACAPRGVPVTLKMRTGRREGERNAVALARRAEAAGITMLTVHGRTREQGFKGLAEYDTIAAVKAALTIPVVANGDIDSPEKARDVLAHTRADALMIGRAAQGRPWIFQDVAHFLASGNRLAAPTVSDVARWLTEHLHDHYALYGECSGVRSARKHIGWALRELPGGEVFRAEINRIDDCAAQVRAVGDWFARLAESHERLPRIARAAAANDDEIALTA
ncbi:MAG: tRNA dihydrouridine synthase DusB [Aquincola sp.]|nr:tRNA dihydrouridine synthase DusB [Aquincola sp.]MDH4289251.1 tRNA dihydrouridine synthase DusB [Aquincola sp.]MDH5332090.1 tRNA dihydrouridine synthase DusB [Aquincola sp.]